MRTVGRRAEREKIARISAAVHESSLVLVGDVGIGKTRLLEAVQAESTIEAVLLRINPAESHWPLSGFSAMLSSIDDSRAVEFGGRFVLRSTDPEHMFAAARDLLTLIRGLALSPMLLLVDDVDQMDQESQVLVGFIAGRLGGTGIRFIATASRLDPAGPFGGLPHDSLEPLDAADALDLLGEAVRPSSEGALSIVVGQSDGNPRALLENLTDLRPEQVASDHPLLMPMVPGPTARAIGAHAVEGLGRTQRALLDRLSTAPLSLRSIATAGGMAEEDALHDLIFAGHVDVHGNYVALRSALLRSHLYWSMGAKSRRDHHAAAAEAYKRVDSRISLWHGSFGGTEVDPTTIMTAAVSFAREGHVATAVELTEDARRRAIGSELLPGLADLAEALFLRGELALAARYVEVGLSYSQDSTASLGLAVLRLKTEFMRTQRLPDLDFEAWGNAYAAEHPRVTAELLAVAGLCLALRWEVDSARSLVAQAHALLPAASRSAARFQDSANQLIEATEGRGPRRSVSLLSPQRSPNRRVVDLLVAGRSACLWEEYAQARKFFSIVLGQRPTPEPIWMDAARYLLADNEIRAGHFTSARAAVAQWRSSRIIRANPASHSYLDAWLAYAEGRIPDAHALLAERLAHFSHEDNPGVAASLLTLKGELSLIDGDPEEAVRLLSLAELVGGQFRNPALVRHSADYIEAAVLAGHAAQAASALQEFEHRAAEHPSRWTTLALARARATAAEDEVALERFATAIGSTGPTDSGLEVGRLHLAHASKLEGMGMATEARAALSSARSALYGASATPWLQRVDTALGLEPEDMHPTLLRHLSDEELEVVHLVQQGLRNKEIASRLYISVRTVELRLTHIYRKVGARSRSHLVSLMS